TGRSMSRSSLLAIVENLLDRHVEQAGDAECQRQRRIVLAGFDRVDRLARHVEAQGQLRLAPVALGAQHFQPVLHGTPTWRMSGLHDYMSRFTDMSREPDKKPLLLA